ncbi:hypothetical protein [Methanolobus halotolerans]|uniref:Uncharacterized protein n=1 Tax=Methanolobus halotolerans TaxID=2052935 RepID=A0A4E0QBL4_9EURY|nr:hypothetical protein [Methanolobus halotolerans]TGC10564.1 hypothetical protein CUN85_03465 [Methanolobus halotolerans]
MIRLENMFPQAFLVGVVKMVDKDGPLETIRWLQEIGEELATLEGPGFEGARENSINYLPICPFGSEITEFIEIYGYPAEFNDIVNKMYELKNASDKPWKYPALTHVMGVLQHSYSTKRAALAGAELYNLGSKSPKGEFKQYNEEALEKAGMAKEVIEELLERSFYVYKIVHPDKE